MESRQARRLLTLRNEHIQKDQRAEAYITAWMTAVLSEAGLLFGSYRPQAICKGRGKLGAGEYDFVRLDSDGLGVILELKPAYFSTRDLEATLFDQAIGYAQADRRFNKGFAIVTNGYEYAWTAVHSPTRSRTFYCHGTHELSHIDSPDSLVNFVRRILSPSEASVDKHLATMYCTGDILQNLKTHSGGTQTSLWFDLLDAVRDASGWSSRKQSGTINILQSLSRDLRRHAQFREAPLARAIYRVLSSPDHLRRLEKNIEAQHGATFPASAAVRHALVDFRSRLPS